MKPNQFSLGELDESFPALDPRTNELRYFLKPDKFSLALAGKHPDHPGVVFKKLSPAELERYKDQHQDREASLKRKKYIMIQFILLMKQFLKLTDEKRKTIAPTVVQKFKLKKNPEETKVYVSGGYTNYEKALGISGAKIIEVFQNAGAEVPLKKPKKLDTKYFTRGQKKTHVQRVSGVSSAK